MVVQGERGLRKFVKWCQKTTRRVTDLVQFPFKPHPRLKRLEAKWKYLSETPGYQLRCYIVNLGVDEKSEFCQNINSFIECTRNSYEKDATVVLTNVRQFITGMKNYLLENGGKKFTELVAKAKQNDTNKSFNLDDILESVLYELVAEPLFDYIVDILADECYGGVVEMIENSKDICQYSLQDLGIKVEPFSEDIMGVIQDHLRKMQVERNPLDKMDYFLGAITVMIKTARSSETGDHAVIFADEFIPLLVWMLAKCGVMTAEMELMYIWGLINPSFRNGEYGYYLTSLNCAISVLKEPERLFETYKGYPKFMWQTERIEQDRHTIRILVPDINTGVPCVSKTLKGMPDYTAGQVCQTMARKLHTKNPELYGLFKLVNGEASLLGDNVNLLKVLNEEMNQGNLCFFIYNPNNVEFSWLYYTELESTVKDALNRERLHFLCRFFIF